MKTTIDRFKNYCTRLKIIIIYNNKREDSKG